MPGMNSIIAGAAFVKIGMDSAELTKGLKESQSRMKRFIAAVNEWGTQIGLVSAMVQAPFVKAIQIFSDFDLKMRQVKAITGATGREFDELSEKARALGRATSFTTAQVADGMVALGRLGFSVKEVQDAIHPVMNLAKATGDDLAVAAQVAGNQMRVFGLDSSKLGDITDVVVTTVNKSAQTLNDFAEAAVKAGPNFANTGSDIREMSASLGVLANMGIRGALAGTALSRSVKRLADPRVKEFLRTFGIDVEDAQKNMRPLHETLADVAKVMSTLSHAERIHIAEEIFEVRGSLAGLPLSVNAAAIDEFLQKLHNCGGEAARVAKEMDSGIYGAIKRMESAFNDLYITIGKLWSFDFADIIADVTKLVNSVNKASDSVKGVIGFALQFGTVSLAVGVLVKGFSMWLYAAKQLVSPLMAIDKIVSGAAAKAERSYERQKRAALDYAATESRATAERIKNEAAEAKRISDADAEIAKSKREEQKKVAKQMDASTVDAKNAKSAAAKARDELKTQEEGYQKSIRAAQSEVAVLESKKSAMKDTLETQKQTLEAAQKEVEEKRKASLLADKQYEKANDSLDRAKGRDALSGQLQLDAAEKKAANDKLQEAKKLADEETKRHNKRIVELKNEISKNDAAQNKTKARLDANNRKIAEGQKINKGLHKIDEQRLVTLQQQRSSLDHQLSIEQGIAKEAKNNADSITRQAQKSQNAYDKASSKAASIVGANVKAAQAEADAKKKSADNARLAYDSARSAESKAQNDLDLSRQQANANDLLIKQKNEQIAKDREAMAHAQATAEKTIASQQKLQADAEATNATLRAQNRELNAEAANAEAVASKSRKAYEEKEKEAVKAQKLAEQSDAASREFGSKAARHEIAQKEVERLQSERDAAQRVLNEKSVTLAKAQEAKKQAAINKSSADIKAATTQEEVYWSNENARASISSTVALKEFRKNKLNALMASIEYDKAEIASHEKVIASIEKEKAAYIANAKGKAKENIERGRDVNVKHYDKQIAKERELIAAIQTRIKAERKAHATEMSDVNNEIKLNDARIAQLKKEIRLRLADAEARRKAGGYAGRQSYFAAEKVIDAELEMEAAQKRLIAINEQLAEAKKKVLTPSERYIAVMKKAKNVHLMNILFEDRHMKAMARKARIILKTSAFDVFAAARSMGASKLRAAGYFAEAAGAKVAAVATLGFKKALDLLSKHPIMIALAALAATMTIYSRVTANAAEKARGTAAAFGKSAEEHAKRKDELQKELAEMEDEFGYLAELEKQTELTTEQQQSAIDVIARLTDKYGDLGIAIDSVTGKLTGATNAQKALTEQQREEIKKEMQAEIDFLNRKVKALYKANKKTAYANSNWLGEGLFSNGTRVTNAHRDMLRILGFNDTKIWGGWRSDLLKNLENFTEGDLKAFKERVQNALIYATNQGTKFSAEQQELEDLKDTLEELIKRRKEFDNLNKNQAGGKQQQQRAEITPAPTLKDAEDARKRMDTLEEAASDRHLSDLQKESKAIEKNREEYRKLIETQLEYHRNELKIAEDKLKSIPQYSSRKSDRVAREANEAIVRQQTAAINELSGKLSRMDDIYNGQLSEAFRNDSRNAQRNAENDANSIAEIFANEQKRRAQSAETEQYNKLVKDNNFTAAIDMMEDLLAKNSEALKQATEEYNSLYRQAREGGYYDGSMGEQDRIDMQASIERVRSAIQEAAQRETHLLQQRDEARRAAENAVTKGGQSAVGSFSAAALSRAVGASGLQLRIAKATEGTKSTLDILKASISSISNKVGDLNSRLAVAGA